MKIRAILVLISFLLIMPALAVERIATDVFAALPDISQAEMSPSGRYIAFITRDQSEAGLGSAVLIYDNEKQSFKWVTRTDNKKYVLEWLYWLDDEYLGISAGFPAVRFGVETEESRLLAYSIKTEKLASLLSNGYLRSLERVPQFQNRIIDVITEPTTKVLLALGNQARAGSEVVLAQPGKKKKPKTIHKFRVNAVDWWTDRDGEIRLVHLLDGVKNIIQYREKGKRSWQTLWQFESLSEDYSVPIGFDHDPNEIYYQAYHEGRQAVFKTNLLEPSKKQLVRSHKDYDVGGSLVYSKSKKRVIGLRNTGVDNMYFFDQEYQSLGKTLDKVLPATDNVILDYSNDENQLLIYSWSDIHPGTYYTMDRKNRSMLEVAKKYMHLKPENMRSKKRVTYAARDGLPIEAYLTLPEAKGPHPTVIFPHGGPISYDGRGFDYWTQFFANRGYAVLQMNFRGSSGYGFDFLSQGLGNWGKTMQSDVEDGTKWMIKQGHADADRICVVGASYGGYAALLEATSTEKLYQCAVSFAGVTDLPKLMKNSRRYLNQREILSKQIGSSFKKLSEVSPVNKADEINIPVLLVHGTKDRSVPIDHARKMVRRLKKAGADFQYIEQKDGTHYLSNEINRQQFFKEMEQFLHRHLAN